MSTLSVREQARWPWLWLVRKRRGAEVPISVRDRARLQWGGSIFVFVDDEIDFGATFEDFAGWGCLGEYPIGRYIVILLKRDACNEAEFFDDLFRASEIHLCDTGSAYRISDQWGLLGRGCVCGCGGCKRGRECWGGRGSGGVCRAEADGDVDIALFGDADACGGSLFEDIACGLAAIVFLAGEFHAKAGFLDHGASLCQRKPDDGRDRKICIRSRRGGLCKARDTGQHKHLHQDGRSCGNHQRGEKGNEKTAVLAASHACAPYRLSDGDIVRESSKGVDRIAGVILWQVSVKELGGDRPLPFEGSLPRIAALRKYRSERSEARPIRRQAETEAARWNPLRKQKL